MADRVKKMGRQKYKNLNIYLENKKHFLDEIKNIFHSFWRASMWWKTKILKILANTSFKGKQLK